MVVYVLMGGMEHSSTILGVFGTWAAAVETQTLYRAGAMDESYPGGVWVHSERVLTEALPADGD